MILLLINLLIGKMLWAQESSIIPKPMATALKQGKFVLDNHNSEAVRMACFFNDYLAVLYGFRLKQKPAAKVVQLKIVHQPETVKERYRLEAGEKNIFLTAYAPDSLFYGMQSLKQLLLVEVTNGSVEIPVVAIHDKSRFSWRGVKDGIHAAGEQHDVLMSPFQFMYFNFYQTKDTAQEPLAYRNFLTLEKVYQYERLPEEVTADEIKHILGLQSNLWTAYIPDGNRVEDMLLPRLRAESEERLRVTEKTGNKLSQPTE